MITEEQKGLLGQKLDPSKIAEREQSGKKLSYIESHHAIREANRIFGFDGWDRSTDDPKLVREEVKPGKNGGENWHVSYTCKVHITALGRTRDGVGYGNGIDKDKGAAHESASKEAESDAMKRAFMTFGDQFGLALYDKKKAHVARPGESNYAEADERHDADAFLLWMKAQGQLSDGQRTQFERACAEEKENWFKVADDANGVGVSTFAQLMRYIKDGEKPAGDDAPKAETGVPDARQTAPVTPATVPATATEPKLVSPEGKEAFGYVPVRWPLPQMFNEPMSDNQRKMAGVKARDRGIDQEGLGDLRREVLHAYGLEDDATKACASLFIDWLLNVTEEGLDDALAAAQG